MDTSDNKNIYQKIKKQNIKILVKLKNEHKNTLKDFFVSNGFPANLILSVIKHFLDRRINNTTTTTTVPDEATEHIKYISLPFFGPQSEKLKNEILSLFNKYCSHFTIKVILSNNFKIGSFSITKISSLCVLARPSCINLIVLYVEQRTLGLPPVLFV